MLVTLLNARLIDVGDDDAKLHLLADASQTLAARLGSDPARVVPYALVSVDQSTPVDDPVYKDADAAIGEKWATYRSKWPDPPTQVWRAVIADALMSLAKEDTAVAAATAFTWASVLPRIHDLPELSVFYGAYQTARDSLEAVAVSRWSKDGALSSKDMGVENIAKRVGLVVDEKQLIAALFAATGPTGVDDTPIPGANPNTAAAGAPWSKEFAPRAASAIARSVNAALAQFTEQASTNFAEHGRIVTETFSGVQSRSGLLWWRAALYSPQTHASYRESDEVVAACQMAVDLHAQVPEYTPESIEHFLRECVRELIFSGTTGAHARTMPRVRLEEVLRRTGGALRGLPVRPSAAHGRAALLTALEHMVIGDGSPDIKQQLSRLGPPAAEEVSLDDLAAWIFRDLQAERVLRSRPRAA